MLLHREPETAERLLLQARRCHGDVSRGAGARGRAGADAVRILGGRACHPMTTRASRSPPRRACSNALRSARRSAHLLRERARRRCCSRSHACRSTSPASTGAQSLSTARAALGAHIAVQGNLDPAALFAPPEALRRASTPCWRMRAPRPVTSSISATASGPRRIRMRSRCWSSTCTSEPPRADLAADGCGRRQHDRRLMPRRGRARPRTAFDALQSRICAASRGVRRWRRAFRVHSLEQASPTIA